MKSTAYYPDLDPSLLPMLELIFDQMLDDPLWLDRTNCPYDKMIVDQLRELWIKVRAEPVSNATDADASPARSIADATDKWATVEQELVKLFDELRNFAKDIDEEDVKEKMAYFRTATSLLDKITGMGERVQNVKAVSDFQARVVSIFDEILTPEQRTLAMEKLGK